MQRICLALYPKNRFIHFLFSTKHKRSESQDCGLRMLQVLHPAILSCTFQSSIWSFLKWSWSSASSSFACSLFSFSSFNWEYNSFTKSCKSIIIIFQVSGWPTALYPNFLMPTSFQRRGGISCPSAPDRGETKTFSRKDNKIFSLHWPPKIAILPENSHRESYTTHTKIPSEEIGHKFFKN